MFHAVPQNAVHAKSITSVVPAVPGTLSVAVVVEFAVKYKPVLPAAVVSSLAWQDHPLDEVKPPDPFIVMTTEQMFAPMVNLPAEPPPVVEETEQPLVANFVPPDSYPGADQRVLFYATQVPVAVVVPVHVR
jgi:hypothetical protein